MSVADSEPVVSLFSEGEPPFLSPRRISEVLGIEQSELATLVGVSKKAWSTKPDAPEIEQALRPLVRILATTIEMTGEGNRAALWFKHQPIPGWAGKTAYDLVGEGKIGEVSNYLESTRSSVYA